MPTIRPLCHGAVSASEYLCSAGPHTPEATECHGAWSISYVRRGSFGCRCGGRQHQLVPGSVLLGRPQDEYVCSHDHHAGGDECLAFFFEPALLDELRLRQPLWRAGALPPLAPLATLGELAQAALAHRTDVALDEIGLQLAARLVDGLAGKRRTRPQPSAADQRRAVAAAMWIEAHSEAPIGLDDMARAAGLSPYHFARMFGAVLEATPHQVLVRARLRKAARLLADGAQPVTEVALAVGFGDLSNFVRSFHRAAGASPRAFRQMARGQRKICQDRLAAPA